jgi:hypothetical protein
LRRSAAERDRLQAAIEKHYAHTVGGSAMVTAWDEDLYRVAGLDVPEMP